MARVLKDSFKNALHTDRKGTENVFCVLCLFFLTSTAFVDTSAFM